MSVQKRDINLFKAAGGERAKAKKRPITSYLIMILVIAIIGAIGAIAFFNYTLLGLKLVYQNQQNLSNNYDITIDATSDYVAQYQAVINEMYQAQKISQYITLRSSRNTKATTAELEAVRSGITGFNYELDVNLVTNGQTFLSNLDKANPNYDIIYGALSHLISQQMQNRRQALWYDYFRGQLVVVFSGGQITGVNLSELSNSLYNGILYEGVTYEPFMNLQVNGARYSNAKYMAASIDSETVYNVMLLTMKTVEERAINILEQSASRMFAEAVLSGSPEDFGYEINKIEYNNENGLLTVEITIIESKEFTIKDLLDDLDASVFFEVSSEVVSPPMSGQKTVAIILEISGAFVLAQQ